MSFGNNFSRNAHRDLNQERLDSLYPVIADNQRQLEERNTLIEWDKVFFRWKLPHIKEKMESFLKLTPYYNFYQAIKYEYGCDGTTKDLNKAYSMYKDNADNTNDILSMYRLYIIHLREYNKFSIKRDRILEKYYLFKCISYSEFAILDREDFLFQRIDPEYEAELHIDLEDSKGDKFHTMMRLLRNNKNYNFRLRDILLIEFCINLNFGWLNQDNLLLDIEPLCFVNSNEGLAKLAYAAKKIYDKRLFLFYMRKCIEKGEYNSHTDLARYLYNINNKEEAKKVAKEGAFTNNRCGRLYNTIFMFMLDFDKLKTDKSLQKDAIDLMECPLNCFLMGDVYSGFEFCQLYKNLSRHYGLKEEICQKYGIYLQEITEHIVNYISKKDEIIQSFNTLDAYSEMMTMLEMVYLYDFGVPKPYLKLQEYETIMKRVINENESTLNKQLYCYFLYKIQRRMLKVNLIKQSELSHTEILLLKWSKGVYEEKLSVAPSTYYVLARMHEKGIGIHTNGFAAYAYYKKSIELEGKLNFFSPTWLAYRKYKARKKMKSEYFLKIVNELNSMTCDTMTEDEKICCICYDNVKNIVILPCFHKLCANCYAHIKDTEKCPICRGLILYSKKIS